MDINPYSSDCAEISRRIDSLIEECFKGLKVGDVANPDKDMAKVWLNRGQIVALEKIKGMITVKEE